MARQDGTNLLLKIGDGGSPENFTTIGGVSLTAMRLRSANIENPRISVTSPWQKLRTSVGRRQVQISVSGEFEDTTAEETLRSQAFSGSMSNYELLFANGDKLSGAFIISLYERDGNVGEPERYNITMESAGDIVFAAA